MDNAVLNIKKGQGITLVIEGYEDHAASFEHDDVLQVILTQAQTDLNKRRSERQRLAYEKDCVEQKYNAANQCATGTAIDGPSGLGLYPRNH
jgi:hypothetical protein